MTEKMDSAEIEDAIRRYTEALREANYDLSKVSKTTVEEFNNAKAGIKNYTYQLNTSLKQLGQASLDLTSKLAKGEQGAGIYNDSIKAGANAIDVFASKFGIWGNIIGGAVMLFAKYVTAAAEQSDKLFGTYQQLSKVGAAGTNDLLGMVHQLGYTIKDLDQFSNFVKKNSETLALYNGTVNQGTMAFAKVTQGFKDSGLQTQLRLMGLQIEDINQGIAGYQRIQTMSGSAQRKTTAEIVQGSAEYIKQLDLVTKLTGKTAEAQQAETEARLRESSYLAFRMQLEQKRDRAAEIGDTATKEHFQNTLDEVESMLKQASPELANMMKGGLTGYVGTSKASQQLFLSAPGAFDELAAIKQQGLGKGQGGGILDRMRKEGLGNAGRNLELFQFQNKGEEFFGPLSAFATIGQERAKAAKDAEDEQKKQKTAPTDMVKAQVSMRQAQESATRNTEAFVNLGVKPATEAMETFSDVIDTVSDKLLPGSSAARGKSAPAPRTGGQPSSLLDIIGQGESGGNYNALVGGREANLTNMTIAEVQKLQSTMIKSGHASTAVGKYQMIAATLAEQAKKAGLDPNRTKFDQSTQDLLASQLVGQAGYGRKDSATVMKNLAGTWASLPQDMSGRGRYDGYNTNRANINPNDLLSAIQSGPKDRYSPALASISSNIPKTVVPGFDSTAATTERKSSEDMLRMTIAKQDEMIALLRANNAQNQKMIQHARS